MCCLFCTRVSHRVGALREEGGRVTVGPPGGFGFRALLSPLKFGTSSANNQWTRGAWVYSVPRLCSSILRSVPLCLDCSFARKS